MVSQTNENGKDKVWWPTDLNYIDPGLGEVESVSKPFDSKVTHQTTRKPEKTDDQSIKQERLVL